MASSANLLLYLRGCEPTLQVEAPYTAVGSTIQSQHQSCEVRTDLVVRGEGASEGSLDFEILAKYSKGCARKSCLSVCSIMVWCRLRMFRRRSVVQWCMQSAANILRSVMLFKGLESFVRMSVLRAMGNAVDGFLKGRQAYQSVRFRREELLQDFVEHVHVASGWWIAW